MEDYKVTQTGDEIQEILNQSPLDTADIASLKEADAAEREARQQADELLMSNIDSEEYRAKEAEQANASDISVINGKIPAEASAENKLVDNAALQNGYYTKAAVDNLIQAIGQNDVIVGALPSTGLANTIYRVPGDGEYSDYMWYNGAWQLLATYSANTQGYQYIGIATPTTNPGTPSNKVFYFAHEAGTYTNFGSIAITQGINILKYDGTSWSLEKIIGVDNIPTSGSENMVKSGGVAIAIGNAASAIDLRLDNYTREFSITPSQTISLPGVVLKSGKTYSIRTSGDGQSYVVNLYNGSSLVTSFNTAQSATNRVITPESDYDELILGVGAGTDSTTFKIVISTENLTGKVNSIEFSLNNAVGILSLHKNANFLEGRAGYRISSIGKSAQDAKSVRTNQVQCIAGSTIRLTDKANTSYDIVLWENSGYSGERLLLNRNIKTDTVLGRGGYLTLALYNDADIIPSDFTTFLHNGFDCDLLVPQSYDTNNKVDFTQEQSLTDAQKQTARTNIGAADENVLDALEDKVTDIESEIYEFDTVDVNYTKGYINGTTGYITNYKNALYSSRVVLNAGSIITLDTSVISNLIYEVFFYNKETGNFDHRTDFGVDPVAIAEESVIRVLVTDTEHKSEYSYVLPDKTYANYVNIKNRVTKINGGGGDGVLNGRTMLVNTQMYIAEDWHFPFIDVTGMGLGANHIIPGTAKTWDETGTTDLVQKNVWMYDGIHPYGHGTEGVNKMYGRTIANQLALVSPSYKVDDNSDGDPSYWDGKVFCWLGTSIPAGNDPALDIQGATDYPRLAALQLGATRINLARGSSMVRINAANGKFTGIPKSHFLRAATRMIAEADYLATPNVWATIYEKQSSYGESASASDISTMKAASYESFLKPYLDGTHAMPDLFVIDHGHNDYAKTVDNNYDWEVLPNQDNIDKGLLEEDSYMTDNDYANLKLALNNNLSGIQDLRKFAVSLNRNCFVGAMNFLITVILSYNPYARIVIVSDYN